MKRLSAICLLSILPVFSALVFAKDIIVTCPNSGADSPKIELTLTAQGGFELDKDQTMLLPLRFDHGEIKNAAAQEGIKLSCVYLSSTEKAGEKKTVTLTAEPPSNATNCKPLKNDESRKVSKFVCTSGGAKTK